MVNQLKKMMKCNKITNYFFNYIKNVYYYFYKLKNKKNLSNILLQLNQLHIESIYSTAQSLVHSNKSLGRFGDGELSLAFTHNNLRYTEKHSKRLSVALNRVLNNYNRNFLVGLPDSFRSLTNDNINPKRFWLKFINNYCKQILPCIRKNKIYYNTSVTRPYMDFKNKKDSGLIFYLMKKIWFNKDVLIIEGEQSRVGVKDDLLKNAHKIKRIECPVTNAFESYDKILNIALHFLNHHKTYITLLSLGATSTVMSFDICNKGFRAIDIGNLDLEYEWYLKGALNKINLSYKYVLEVPKGNHVLPISHKSRYYKEIIYKV